MRMCGAVALCVFTESAALYKQDSDISAGRPDDCRGLLRLAWIDELGYGAPLPRVALVLYLIPRLFRDAGAFQRAGMSAARAVVARV